MLHSKRIIILFIIVLVCFFSPIVPSTTEFDESADNMPTLYVPEEKADCAGSYQQDKNYSGPIMPVKEVSRLMREAYSFYAD